MKNLIKAEYYYLFKNIKFYCFIGFIVLWDILGIIFNGALTNGASGAMSASASIGGAQNLLLTSTQGITLIMVAILLLEFAHKDFTNKTMKNYVGNGRPLTKVYFGKLIVCLTAVVAILLVALICEQASYVIVGSQTIGDIAFAKLLIRIFCDTLTCSVVFCICSLIPNAALSILASLFYLIGLPFFFQLVPIEFLQNLSPYLLDSVSSELTGNIATGAALPPEIRLCISIVLIAAITCLGAFLFSKKEVK